MKPATTGRFFGTWTARRQIFLPASSESSGDVDDLASAARGVATGMLEETLEAMARADGESLLSEHGAQASGAAKAAAYSAIDSLRLRADASGSDATDTGMQDQVMPRQVISYARASVRGLSSTIGDKMATSIPPHRSDEVDDEVGDRESPQAFNKEVSTVAEAVISQAASTLEGSDGDVKMEREQPFKKSPCADQLRLAHLLWSNVAGPGDTVVDCTAGNGHDSLALGKIVGLADGVGEMYCLDKKDAAIEATRSRLSQELGPGALDRAQLMKRNFRSFPPALGPESVKLIVYNLGYLPGAEDKMSTKTEKEDTLASLEAALPLLVTGGVISVMCYRGHPEGAEETAAVKEFAAALNKKQWRSFTHERLNWPNASVLFTIFKP
ncbi:unnamed protein product [Discosporangium mesarthrocarpum]